MSQTLHFDAVREDGLGPLLDHAFVLGRIVGGHLIDTLDGGGGDALHFGEQRDGLFVGEDSFRHATRIYPSWCFGNRKLALGQPQLATIQELVLKRDLHSCGKHEGGHTDVGRG
jgi:hypothetical protein